MKILSIETSSEACSVSLNIDGELSTKFELAPQRHSSLILNMCDNLLSEAQISPNDLDAVAFGQGPGSFTGLRIAAGVTQGIAFGADIPVIKVSTLAALAQQIVINSGENTIVTAIDARMHEIYWCRFNTDTTGIVSAIDDEHLTSPETLRDTLVKQAENAFYSIGSGWDEYRDELLNSINSSSPLKIYEKRLVSAEEIGILAANKFKLGQFSTTIEAIPVYLRNNVAKKAAVNKTT